MPLNVAIVAELAAGVEGVRRVAAQMDPPLNVQAGSSDAHVTVVDQDSQVVAVWQRPAAVAYQGDILRCWGREAVEVPSASVWTEGVIPFWQARRGLELAASLAIATNGRLIVNGVQQ